MTTNLQYSSVANTNSERKKRKKEEIPQLARDSFEAFKPFINVYDCGGFYDDHPYHYVEKGNWELFRRHKAGERDLTYPDGTKFHPYHAIRGIYSPWHVHRHITRNDTTYYTSGKKGLGLLYLDIDAHHAWQTDEHRAKEVLQEVCPVAYFRPSKRGQNGYLKVRYGFISEFNRLADHLQDALKRLFLHLGILCDVEVKGTITHGDKSGTLAKLPFTSWYTDSWCYTELRKFQACPVVHARQVSAVARQIDWHVGEARIKACVEQKGLLEEAERQAEEAKAASRRKKRSVAVQVAPPPKPEPPKEAVSRPTKPASVRCNLPASSSDDAFLRNREDLRPFVRAFWKQNRRFPTTQEALDWIRTNNRFSGSWEDRERKRANRVGQILRFTERTFDPSRLGKGNAVSLKVGRFAWWVRYHFGTQLTAWASDIQAFDPVSMTAPKEKITVPAKFVETFLLVAHLCLRQDPLQNEAVPTNRIKKLWGMVKGGAAWHQKHYQIVRDRLHRMGVINIYDREHHSGKAWRWVAGKYFPSQDYREEQHKGSSSLAGARCGHGCAGGTSVRTSPSVFLSEVNDEKEKVHNTLYKEGDGIWADSERIPSVRAPP